MITWAGTITPAITTSGSGTFLNSFISNTITGSTTDSLFLSNPYKKLASKYYVKHTHNPYAITAADIQDAEEDLVKEINAQANTEITLPSGCVLEIKNDGAVITPKLHRSLLINMPDGGKITLHPDGKYEIDDAEAKIVYKANNRREFNRFVNGSDLLADFARYCASFKMSREEFVERFGLFVRWLVISAAEADEIPAPGQVVVELHSQMKAITDRNHARHMARCFDCGRYIQRKLVQAGVNFCGPSHLSHHMAQL